MAKLAEKERDYLDEIDELIGLGNRELHLSHDAGRATEVEKYYSAAEMKSRASDFNKNHKGLDGNDMIEARKKLARRNRKRTLETIIAVGLIIAAGIFFALVLYPQAELSELSRDNSDRKDEISALKKEIIDAKGEAEGITDMDSIRAQAMSMGMQEPNSGQIIKIPLPGSDRLISVATLDSDGVNDDAIDRALNDLKEYYHRNGDKK